MDPAFSSPRQAGAFALLLLLILLLPVLVGKSFLPPREQLYWFFPFHDQIFEEKGEIDIAFMGSSRMGCAIDASYVQQKLSDNLGRPAVVRSLTWTWNGFDALYFIAQDLLEHRKIRMLVFNDLKFIDGQDFAHHQAIYWFRFGDNAAALTGLPLKSKASFYATAIIGMPQNLLDLVRSNLAITPSNDAHWYYSSTEYMPHTTTGPMDARIYSEDTKASFQFSNAPIAPMQRIFIRRIALLAQQHHTQLVFLHVPDLEERGDALLKEEDFWPDVFHTSLPMVGIPPAVLFSGLSDGEVGKLYHNRAHFNQNGQRYFTLIVTPSLIRIYEDQIKP